jgi:response regulator NasT
MKSSVPVLPTLRILVIPVLASERSDDGALAAQAQRAATLRTGLLGSRYEIVASLAADRFLPERLALLQPDLIIIDSEADARDALEQVARATRDAPRPIVVFTDNPAIASMEAAIAAGVSAYVVAGLQAQRVQPVLDVALARFRREQQLMEQLSDTRQKLGERKLIERAKGLLMAHHKLSEDQAYQKLRSMAMNRSLKLAEVAQRILDLEDLLG